MVPDKPQKVENFHFTWCGYIGFRARCYVKACTILMSLYICCQYLRFNWTWFVQLMPSELVRSAIFKWKLISRNSRMSKLLIDASVHTAQKAKSATFLNKIPIGIREELWYEISYADKKCQQKAYGIRVFYRILEEF